MATFHKTAIAPYVFRNTIVKLAFDFDRGIAYGDATSVISPKRSGLSLIPFNSVGLRFSSVRVNGARARYVVSRDHLYVYLPRPASSSAILRIESRYSVHPARGIYFIRPDRYYPAMQPEIWSQGEAEDNRMWLPTWDEPNQKTPVEQIVTVPKGWTVTANGHLKSHTSAGATTTWDWVEPAPISTYLIAFSAGPYVKFHTQTGRTPVDFFVSRADAKWGPLCFGNTKEIVAYFQGLIGVPYPWEKYDQTAVERFTAGGMENASATTQTELAVHPPAYDRVRPCDGLVSHELAHQWWGDDVTMSDWANVWINEGYATYFEELWARHRFGNDQFDYERYKAQQAYFNETKRYWRPIVDYDYADAMDSFDASGYQRPGQVLHMLNVMFGDRRFFGALRSYLLAYQHRNADTQQFFAAIDKALGTNLGWFEDEWFFRAAYPHFIVNERYDANAHALALDVAQKNHDGKPFEMPIDVAVYWQGGSKTQRFQAGSNHQTVTIGGIPAPPLMVLFDPGNNVLRQLDDSKPVATLGYEAVHAPDVPDRLWALAKLGETKGKDAVAARAFVREAVTRDPFYGVRVQALDAAGSLDDAQTVRLALHDRDARVAIAAGAEVENLDHPNVPGLVHDLEGAARSANALVAGSALRGLGATKARGVYPILVAGLNRHAFREPIASGALAGLASYGDVRAVPLIEARAAYGVDESERPAAIAALATLTRHRPQLSESFLIALAQHDPYFRARAAAVRALGRLGRRSAIPALRRIESTDPEPSVANGAWDAIADLNDRAPSRRH